MFISQKMKFLHFVTHDIICVCVTVHYWKSKLDMRIQKGEFGSVINRFINKVHYK